mgnify:CR=1 FL=1
MKKHITLSIDERLIRFAKAYAKRRFTTVSDMVTQNILMLMEQERKRRRP